MAPWPRELPMSTDPLLRVRDLSKTYFRRRWLAPPRPATFALAGVSFSLDRARTLAVVGASGSGKSTLARCLTQFETPSGGEILFEGRPLSPQRPLAIARALVVEPKLVILDESFNGLDASLAAQVAALLSDLQQRLGIAYILISHDLMLVAGLAHEIAVMEHGAIVEHGLAATLMSQPRHPHTRQLLAAALALEGGAA